MKRVLIAMSGGLDSACAAHLLIQQGYKVTGITLKLTADDAQCQDAKALAEHLGIDHVVYDVIDNFKGRVINRFKRDYFSGITPNPCVYCNQKIKFGLLYEYMLAHEYDYLATGHYACIHYTDHGNFVAKAKTYRRDQSYFLYHLTQDKLKRILFPLGNISSKEKTFELYKSLSLSVEDKPESRGICFIDKAHYADYLMINAPHLKKGEIIDVSGNVRGVHQGFYAYTIGQKNLFGADMLKSECVLQIDSQNNRVIIGDESLCYSHKVHIDELHYTGNVMDKNVNFKIFNWGHWLVGKVIAISSGIAVIEFDTPVRAVATGQYAVGYYDDRVVIGGRIIKAE